MSQLLFDIHTASVRVDTDRSPEGLASMAGTTVPAQWTPTPAPLPKPGNRLVDRHGRTATVEAVRDDGIDIRLDHPSTLGHGAFCGLYPPTWWRDWRIS